MFPQIFFSNLRNVFYKIKKNYNSFAVDLAGFPILFLIRNFSSSCLLFVLLSSHTYWSQQEKPTLRNKLIFLGNESFNARETWRNIMSFGIAQDSNIVSPKDLRKSNEV